MQNNVVTMCCYKSSPSERGHDLKEMHKEVCWKGLHEQNINKNEVNKRLFYNFAIYTRFDYGDSMK